MIDLILYLGAPSHVYPKYYREEDIQTILAIIRENEFATLVTYDGEKPVASHLLVELTETHGGNRHLRGHVAGEPVVEDL